MKSVNKKNSYSLNSNTNKNLTKFKSMSKLIVNKIDDILEQYPNNLASNSILPYTDVYSDSKNIITNINDNNHYNRQETNNSKKIKKKKINKDTFLTDVEIENSKMNQRSKYIEENDKKIKEMIDNIDDIDNFLNDDEEKEYLSLNPEHKDDVNYFKNLIREVDTYRKNVKEEYDELQYLIKFVEDTKGRLNRHKNGVSNLFTQIGIKPQADRYGDSDKENSDDEKLYTQDGTYNRQKGISKVKDNLLNLQGGVINFYQNFSHKMKLVEMNNKQTQNIKKNFPKEFRANTTDIKLRAKSKPR